jgi:6-pyruvoyl-tetrahydropterin synthase
MIRHNAEIAHRLSLTEGKCQQIHGHGLQIELTLLNLSQDRATGMAKDASGDLLDFSDLKKRFRKYIDEGFDHHLLLNTEDPWAGVFYLYDPVDNDPIDNKQLPGLVQVPGDPTIENLAKWWAMWAANEFKCDTSCRIDETSTNSAEVRAIYGKQEATVR